MRVIIFLFLSTLAFNQESINLSRLTIREWTTLSVGEKAIYLDGVISSLGAIDIRITDAFYNADNRETSGMLAAIDQIRSVSLKADLMDYMGTALDLLAEDPETQGVNLALAISWIWEVRTNS